MRLYLIFNTLWWLACGLAWAQPAGLSNQLPLQLIAEGRDDLKALKPFYYGVASGDPRAEQVVIWTKVTPERDERVSVQWRIATDPALQKVVKSGKVSTDSSRNYTVKVEVTGLRPGTTYYYGFEALKARSLTGRTKTAGPRTNERLRLAVVSCNNFEGGYFNGFGRIADRHDLDAVVHLGDYIYEYGPQTYGDSTLDRRHQPPHEIVSLEDYRTRHAQYRLDPDLRRAHQQHPFITIWDDHESANDAYQDGAENHDPAQEGDWQTRKRVAQRAYFEWLPIADNDQMRIYRRISYGGLADLILLDTRLEGRTQQAKRTTQPDFRDTGREMLGREQARWFKSMLSESSARWKLIGNQVLFSEFNMGFYRSPNAESNPDDLFLDIWRGYPAAREEIISHIADNRIDDVVILTGDIHSSFALDIPRSARDSSQYDPGTGRGSLAVEFVTPSISSANFDEYLGMEQAKVAQYAMMNPVPPDDINYNPHMKFADIINHGYFVLDVTPTRVQADWFMVETLKQPSLKERFVRGHFTEAGQNRLQRAESPVAPGPTVAPAPGQ